MTLGHKVFLLMTFMVSVSLMSFIWFVNRFNHHVTHFKTSFVHDKQALEAKRERSISQLKEKVDEMQEETKDHLSKMEDGLLKQRQNAEAFNEYFLRQQNNLFDKIDNFTLGK